jgi:hypothetical protein
MRRGFLVDAEAKARARRARIFDGPAGSTHPSGPAMSDGSARVDAPVLAVWLRFIPVLSQWNLSAFLHWAQSAEEAVLHQVLDLVYILEHRSYGGGTSYPITVRGHVLRPAPCNTDECIRCTNGQGGYQFRWVSPLWTAKAFIDFENEGQHIISNRIHAGGSPADLPLIDCCPTDAEMGEWSRRHETDAGQLVRRAG